MSEKQPPVVLVHGAWHGAWCWQPLITSLESKGRRVLAPDLPGHGADTTPVSKLTLARYSDSVSALIRKLDTPVVLAGHSMAGMVISSVANILASEGSSSQYIDRLVYINAYLPVDGDSVFSLVESYDKHSAIAAAMQLSADKRSFTLKGSDLATLFYNETPEKQYSFALEKIRPQASLPLSTGLKLDQDIFAGISKTVICSGRDRVIPLAMQYHMLARQPCDELIQIDGDHSLFFSATEELSRLINSQ